MTPYGPRNLCQQRKSIIHLLINNHYKKKMPCEPALWFHRVFFPLKCGSLDVYHPRLFCSYWIYKESMQGHDRKLKKQVPTGIYRSRILWYVAASWKNKNGSSTDEFTFQGNGQQDCFPDIPPQLSIEYWKKSGIYYETKGNNILVGLF